MDLASFPILSPAIILPAFLAGAVTLLLLRPFFRWYFGLNAIEESLHRLEKRLKSLQGLLIEAEGEGPSLPHSAPSSGPGLPGLSDFRGEGQVRPMRRKP